MKLPKIDLLDAEAANAQNCLLAEVFGTAERDPHAGAGTSEAGFRRNLDALVGMKRFADQAFADLGAIAVGGIDEIDIEIRELFQRAQAPLPCRRVRPRCHCR